VPYASKEELYALVWQKQCNICNLSGVKGDWKINSLTKLSFDEIVPRNPADDEVQGGDYTLNNIQIVLRAINEMKWNYSNEEAVEYLNTRFAL
jgi:hypothetical protein